MLTHSGFTTVVDVASDASNTVPLRRRIESGEVAGPNIYTSERLELLIVTTNPGSVFEGTFN